MSEMEQIKLAFAKFCQTIAALRHPKTGCPWDLEQTHESLRRYMLEEAYEAVEEMSIDSSDQLCGELGDVLLQVVLNAQLAKDRGAFDIADVIEGIDSKMIRRHPHVFDEKKNHKDFESLRKSWEEIKEEEKKTSTKKQYEGFFGDVANKTMFPASVKSQAIGKRASKIKFDWDDPSKVFVQLRSEIDELEKELENNSYRSSAGVTDELGDVFFTLGQLCRHLGVDAEVTAMGGNRKFLDRFQHLETLAQSRNLKVQDASREELERLWSEAKDSTR